jgi:DNA-binding MarR family transcriptional regulator
MSTPTRRLSRATQRATDALLPEIAAPPPSISRGSHVARGSDEPPTSADLAETLFLTAHALKYAGQRRLRDLEATVGVMSFPQARVMMVMADAERVRMGELSTKLGVTARNVTTIVDGLEREGLLARVPDPDDRRAILLELTPKGREHITAVHAAQGELAEWFFAALNTSERAELLRLLGKILEMASAASALPGCP